MNILQINKPLLYMLLFSLSLVQGCFLFSGDCPTTDYCDGNEYWSATGTTDFGCDNYLVADCSLTGRVCLVGNHSSKTRCYHENTQCKEGVKSYCEGDTLVICDSDLSLGLSKIDCSEAGLICGNFNGDFSRCTQSCEEDESDCFPVAENLFYLKYKSSSDEYVLEKAEETDVMQCIDGYWMLEGLCNVTDTDGDIAIDSDFSTDFDTDFNTDTDTDFDTDFDTDTDTDTGIDSEI